MRFLNLMNLKNFKNFTNSRGFIALLTVITLLVFSLSLTVATTYLSIGESQSALALTQGEAALQLAEGCAEDALLLSKRDDDYAGGTYGYLDGTCQVNVEKDLLQWTFDIVATKGAFTRRLEITVGRTLGLPGLPATLALQSWLEQ